MYQRKKINHMRKIFIIFATIIIQYTCVSCDNSDVRIINNKEPDELLISKKHHIEPECLLPLMISIVKDKIVIYNKVKNNKFSVFNLYDHSLLYQFGNSGVAPDEFKSISHNSIREYNGHLTLLDQNRLKIINLESTKMEIISSTPLSSKISSLSSFTLINDVQYISDNRSLDTDDEVFLQSISKEDEILGIGTYPFINHKINRDQIQRENIARKSIASRRSDGRICFIYSHLHRIRIFTKTGRIVNDVSIGSPPTIPGDFNLSNEKLYTGQVYTTDNYIYSLNLNARESDLFCGKNQTPILEIWDWEGSLIRTFALDEEILGFCVSEENNKIYATTLNYTNKILIYDLP